MAQGQALLRQYDGPLRKIAQDYGVPPSIVVALWGMETDFGKEHSDRDILRSLATLSYIHPDDLEYVGDFTNALVMIERGAPREKLRGSWAGAMGDPQFTPTAYLKYAVKFSGAGAPDIWSSGPDALASIANLLKQSEWRVGRPPLIETRVPPGFGYDSLEWDFSALSAAGFRAVDGAPLPRSGKAMLYFPVRARRPAFLLSDNFFVLKA